MPVRVEKRELHRSYLARQAASIECLNPAQNAAVHLLMSVQGRIAVQGYLDLQRANSECRLLSNVELGRGSQSGVKYQNAR